eukprot:6607260-Prymnesium_polylepis.1
MRLGTPLGRSTGARERAARAERACAHLSLQLSAMAVRVSMTRASSPQVLLLVAAACTTSAHASGLSSRPQTYSAR